VKISAQNLFLFLKNYNRRAVACSNEAVPLGVTPHVLVIDIHKQQEVKKFNQLSNKSNNKVFA